MMSWSDRPSSIPASRKRRHWSEKHLLGLCGTRLPEDWLLSEAVILRLRPHRGAEGRVILVDTSVWIDHLRKPEAKLQDMLLNDEVVTHPFVRLELALGSLASREEVLADLALLPHASISATDELFRLLELRRLYRRGIGITDLHLVASALLDKSVLIWTRDRRLAKIAEELGVRAAIP
jgi:predicted nucleic acid-binding protein